jgi:hypothetical protein
MGYIIRWDNADKTVVLQQYTEAGSRDDLYSLAQESAQMLGTVEHTVHLIIDEEQFRYFLTPADMSFLESLVPQNQGAVVMVVPASKLGYKTSIQRIGHGIAPNAFAEPYFAESVAAARQFLQESLGVRYATETSEESG